MKLTPKAIEAITALGGPERYAHFIKVVADQEEIWGLDEDGWALAETDDGQQVLPLWPAKDFAQACAEGPWQVYSPLSLQLDELMKDLLPRLKADGVLVGVFPTPKQKGVTPPIDQLLVDLKEELKKYE